MRISTLTVFIFAFMSLQAAADTVYVPGDYPTIQEAIDGAAAGSEILVDSGTYYECLTFPCKELTVIGTNGPEHTIIDAVNHPDQSVVTFLDNEAEPVHFEGFSLINGTGTRTEFYPSIH